jgi:hypothetical protein
MAPYPCFLYIIGQPLRLGMLSEPIPPLFQLYFYSAIILAALVSLIAIFLYRRAVWANMLTSDESSPVLPTSAVDSAAARAFPVGPASDYTTTELRLKLKIRLCRRIGLKPGAKSGAIHACCGMVCHD